jgi:hypothetical protein
VEKGGEGWRRVEKWEKGEKGEEAEESVLQYATCRFYNA